jgi:hypothetical protein
MRELSETEIDAVSGGFFNATGAGSRAILACRRLARQG